MLWLKITAISLALLLCGCAARRNMGSPGTVELPLDCIKQIVPDPKKSKCTVDQFGKVKCTDMQITRELGCGPKLVVNQKEKEKK